MLRCVLCALLLTPLGAAERPADPPFACLLTTAVAQDAGECRAKALAAEQAGDIAAAVLAWERVIDRCPASEEQRVEARARLKELRPKLARNEDPSKARGWKVLVAIFRQLEFKWTDAQQNPVEVRKTVSEADERKIRGSVAAFGAHVFRLSSGLLRLDTDIRVVETPLTTLWGKGAGPFTPAPHLLRPALEPFLKDTVYDTVIAYVKYNGDQGPSVPAPFVAAAFASIADVKGAGFIMVPWHTSYPFPGETDGEMEYHEWLHQIDWLFSRVLRYPDALVPSSDSGRLEGDTRPGGDPEYARKRSETTWMGLYRHIAEDHITRQMWWEATMRLPAGQTAPGTVCVPAAK